MKVKLLKAHRHSSTSYAVGDIIDVDASTAEWLANCKVAMPSGPSYVRNVAPVAAPVMAPVAASVVPEATPSVKVAAVVQEPLGVTSNTPE